MSSRTAARRDAIRARFPRSRLGESQPHRPFDGYKDISDHPEAVQLSGSEFWEFKDSLPPRVRAWLSEDIPDREWMGRYNAAVEMYYQEFRQGRLTGGG